MLSSNYLTNIFYSLKELVNVIIIEQKKKRSSDILFIFSSSSSLFVYKEDYFSLIDDNS